MSENNSLPHPMQSEISGLFARVGVLTRDFEPVAESDVCNGPRRRHPIMHPVVSELLIKIPGKVKADE